MRGDAVPKKQLNTPKKEKKKKKSNQGVHIYGGKRRGSRVQPETNRTHHRSVVSAACGTLHVPN